MGDIDVEAIKARAEAVSDDWCGYADSVGENSGRCELFSGPMIDAGYRTGSVFAVREDCDCGCFPPSPAEMTFIENARQDIPALLAEVARLRSVVAGVEALADEWDGKAAAAERSAPARVRLSDHSDLKLYASIKRNAARRLRSVLSDTRQEQ